MKKFWKTSWLILLVTIIVVTATIGGVALASGSGALNVSAVSKYEINSYEAKSEHELDRIKYSYSYDDYDFYYIYLGEMANIPIYSDDAIKHDGIAFEYTFSTTNTTTETIQTTVTNSSAKTKSITKQHVKSKTEGGKLGVEFNPKVSGGPFELGVKIMAEENWSDYTSDNFTKGFTKTKSLTDTISYTTTKTASQTITKKFNLTKADKIGYYRYTYFSASDVYLYVVKDPSDPEGKIAYYEFKEHVIPDVYFWQFDYSETPSFEKSDATSFELDLDILDNLPATATTLDVPPAEPNIITQPKDANAFQGDSTSFTIVATGQPKPTYQWQVNAGGGWSNLSNTGIYSGTDTGTLTLSNVSVAYDNYTYRCLVSNGIMDNVASSVATLNVSIDVPTIVIRGNSTFALKSDGTVWAWGNNGYGQLGDGTKTNRNTAVQIKGVDGSGYLTDIIAIAASAAHTLALKSDGTVWAWGYNQYGQLGDGTTGYGTEKSTPVQVKGIGGVGYLSDIVSIAAGDNHTVALKSDGTVWAWGFNLYGQLGDETNGYGTEKSTPVQVKGVGGMGYLTNINSISAGQSHTVALTSDKIVWSWGRNYEGQLGDGTNTLSQNTPVRTKGAGGSGYLTNITSIIASGRYTTALRSDGTVWAWGSNSRGQLGNTSNSNTPMQVRDVGGSGYLTDVTAIAAGSDHTVALKSNGTVLAWGYNEKGGLGNGTKIDSDTPVYVKGVGGTGYLTDIASITAGGSRTVAIKSDGTIWACGSDNSITLNSTTPVQMTNVMLI